MSYVFSNSLLEQKMKNNPFMLLNQAVYGVILDAIVSLQLLPGDRLVERNIADELTVSRTTVSNALKRLSSEGFCTNQKGRCAVVTMPSQKWFADCFHAREAIEVAAVTQACECMTESQLQQLGKLAAAFRPQITHLDPFNIQSAELNFHTYLVQCSNNPLLISMYQTMLPNLRLLTLLYATMLLSSPAMCYDEHQHLYTTISNRSLRSAESAMRAHTSLSFELLKESSSDKIKHAYELLINRNMERDGGQK